MKNKSSHFTDVMYKIIRVGIVVGILATIVGYYIDISKRDTIIIQGLPERSIAEQEPIQTSSVMLENAAVLPLEELSQPESAVQQEQTAPSQTTEPTEANLPAAEPEVPTTTTAVTAYVTTPATIPSTTNITELQTAPPQHAEANIAPVSGLINLNTAPASTLMELDGIGEVKAQAIVQYREEHGSFKSIDELVNVKGIGEKTLEKNRNRITV